MANQEHVDILKQGVEVWNQWRQEHLEIWRKERRDIRPDLNGIDLHETNLRRFNFLACYFRNANLSGVDFRRSSFSRADFRQADLSGAILSGTDLSGADLRMANLTGAHLGRADLMGAKLSGAILVEAELLGVNLNGVDLSGANLSRAKIDWTVFDQIDLSLVKGLETVNHAGPATLGIDTLYRSHGEIPEVFLRGAGIPDSLIPYIRSLVSSVKAIDFYSCFISYSSRDQIFAERLHADLQSKGVRCWFASEDLKIGDHYHQRIDESIRLYDKLILILSEYAVQSAWVEREVVAAREKEDHAQHPVLFPLRLDDAVMDTTRAWAADVRRRWHIGDFTRWKDHDAYQLAFERLLRDLKAESIMQRKTDQQ